MPLLEVLEGPGRRLQGGQLYPRGSRGMSSTVGIEHCCLCSRWNGQDL
jgi:hypothetical protein